MRLDTILAAVFGARSSTHVSGITLDVACQSRLGLRRARTTRQISAAAQTFMQH